MTLDEALAESRIGLVIRRTKAYGTWNYYFVRGSWETARHAVRWCRTRSAVGHDALFSTTREEAEFGNWKNWEPVEPKNVIDKLGELA